MFKIVRKKELNPSVTLMEIEAPLIAKKAKAGQFIIFRVDEEGERIPLTIADSDSEKGTVTIISIISTLSFCQLFVSQTIIFKKLQFVLRFQKDCSKIIYSNSR